MHLDFPTSTTPRHKVAFLTRAIRMFRDPDAYSSTLITAEGVRVYRIVCVRERRISIATLTGLTT